MLFDMQEGEAGADSTVQPAAAVVEPAPSSQITKADPLDPLSSMPGTTGASQRHHHPLVSGERKRLAIRA